MPLVPSSGSATGKCQVTFKSKTPNSKSSLQKGVNVLDEKDSFSVAANELQVLINDIQVHSVSVSSWLSTVSTESGKITLKLDTGAEVSVLPLKIHKCLSNKPAMKHTSITLSAYGGSIIKPVGTCTLKCKGKISSPVTFYVVSVVVQLLLGLTDCIKLGLIQRVHTLQISNMSKDSITVEFAYVFRGLGKLGKYFITSKMIHSQ